MDVVSRQVLILIYCRNIAYSLCGDSFAKWISDQMNARNQKVTIEKDLLINIDPRIYNVFTQSSSISSKISLYSIHTK